MFVARVSILRFIGHFDVVYACRTATRRHFQTTSYHSRASAPATGSSNAVSEGCSFLRNWVHGDTTEFQAQRPS